MSYDVVCKLYDLDSNELADITAIALEKTLKRRASAATEFEIQAPAGHSLFTATADDGMRNLRKGNRKLVVWEDGDVIFHGRVQGVERNGDGTKNLATITAAQPLAELGYESGDRAGRPVRDETGNFIKPSFTSSVPAQDEISGPDLIYQALENSKVDADESPGPGGEGPLPILVDIDNFDLDVPPAVDLTPAEAMVWPILLGDWIQMLVASGVVDVNERPLDPADAVDPYHMVELFARSSLGTDRSSTVHFDYWTGSRNAAACRHVEDFGPINNKLYDYLGPATQRDDGAFYRAGNITPTLAGMTLAAAIAASRALYGVFMQIRVVDTFGDSLAARPFYIASWNAEQGYRVEPRDLLFITPAPDAAGLFEAPADFDVFDLVAINTGAELGLALAEAQRVYGYDRAWDRNGVARTSQLITSADISS